MKHKNLWKNEDYIRFYCNKSNKRDKYKKFAIYKKT